MTAGDSKSDKIKVKTNFKSKTGLTVNIHAHESMYFAVRVGDGKFLCLMQILDLVYYFFFCIRYIQRNINIRKVTFTRRRTSLFLGQCVGSCTQSEYGGPFGH